MPLSLLPPQPVCAITTSAASNRAQNLLIGFPPREREKKRLLARHDISVRARADIFLRANADNRCRCARNARECRDGGAGLQRSRVCKRNRAFCKLGFRRKSLNGSEMCC